MFDMNGIEIKTGMIVEVTGAYFKNDNGLFFVAHSAGDPSWNGRDHSLHKIGKTGKISTAKNNLAFWPLVSFVSSREKTAEAKKWNAEHARIEVKTLANMAEVAAYFTKEAEEAEQNAERSAWHWGEDSEDVKRSRRIAAHYRAVVASIEK